MVALDKETAIGFGGVDNAVPSVLGGGWPGLEIIVDHIVVPLLPAIDAVALPIVDDIVPKIQKLIRGIGRGGRAAETGVPTVVVGNQVVVEGHPGASPDPPVPVFALFVDG